jgi:hypothetical protein
VRPVNQLGEWVLSQLQHVLNEWIAEYLSQHLFALGLGTTLVAVAAPVLAYMIIRSIAEVFRPPPEPAWETIDPNNDKLIQAAFNDLHTRVRAGNMLNENDAQTLEEFRAQLHRIGLYGTPAVQETTKRRELSFESLGTVLIIGTCIAGAILIGVASAALVEYLRGW